MLNYCQIVAKSGLSAVVTAMVFATSKPAASQIVPQPWISIGVKDEEVSYAIGARFLNFGVEIGAKDEAVGGDLLGFIGGIPIVAPYAGVGWYGDDEGFAYSGGVKLYPLSNLSIGAGYHSVRGVNGQIGIQF